jgi:Secretion system C-terminal sorting domain
MEKTLTPICLSLLHRFAMLTIAIALVVTFAHRLSAQCSVVGTGTVTGNVNFGSSNNWANPNRCTITDDLWARVNLSAGETSKYLEVSDYGWVIPVGATILGIQVKIEGHQENFAANFADASIVLMQAGSPVSTDRAGTGYYDDKDYTNTYGSSTDLWGTTWTPADIMDPGFGVLYSVTRLSGTGTYYMYVDYVELTVYYTGVGCILPVTYRAYDVTLQANQTTQIDWVTNPATNADDYQIERSFDGVNFSNIGVVDAQSNILTDNAYRFVDAQVLDATAYYRIKQVDLDGQSYLTEVRRVTGHGNGTLDVKAFPNPATDYLQLRGDLRGGQASLIDLSGRSILQQQLGSDDNTLDVSSLTRGIYVLQIKAPNGHHSQRLAIK